MNILLKLKKKLQIKSNWDFAMVILVYSLAGIGVSISRRTIFNLLGLNYSPLWIKIGCSIILIIPLYQLSTLFFGFILGQFPFFWTRQKVIAQAISRLPQRIFQPIPPKNKL